MSGSAEHLRPSPCRDFLCDHPKKVLRCLIVRWQKFSLKGFCCPLSWDVSAHDSLIWQWKQMIYVQSSLWSLCVIPIRTVGPRACLRTLWVFIETTDCLLEDTQNTIPWECKVPPVPNPFFIFSIPIWVMNIILLNKDHLTTHCK